MYDDGRDYAEEAAIMAAEAPTRSEEKDYEARLDAQDEARWVEQEKELAAADAELARAEEECVPEFIDGTYYGCGICPDCQEEEQERQQRAYERGDVDC